MHVHTVFCWLGWTWGTGTGAAGAGGLSSLILILLCGLLQLADCAVVALAGSLIETWVASKKCINSLTAIGPCSLQHNLDNVT